MSEHSSVINSIIGFGTSYSGNINSIDLLRIDGNYSGNAVSTDSILIGLDGKAKGTLSAKKIIIAGLFQGDIKKTSLLVVQPSAVIIGNIEAEQVIVESGAILCVGAHIANTVTEPVNTEQANDSTVVKKHNEEDVLRIIGKISNNRLEHMFS